MENDIANTVAYTFSGITAFFALFTVMLGYGKYRHEKDLKKKESLSKC